jgi:hypothetical protein
MTVVRTTSIPRRALPAGLDDAVASRPAYMNKPGKLCADERPAEMDPEDWFPLGRGLTASNYRAINLCTLCPVMTECLEYALATDQRDGVWGATTASLRVKILRRRQDDSVRPDWLPDKLAWLVAAAADGDR